jgi:hypothetical protein
MEVKKEITIDTKGGRSTFVVTPDMGKVMFRKSMNYVPPGKITAGPMPETTLSKFVFVGNRNTGDIERNVEALKS